MNRGGFPQDRLSPPVKTWEEDREHKCSRDQTQGLFRDRERERKGKRLEKKRKNIWKEAPAAKREGESWEGYREASVLKGQEREKHEPENNREIVKIFDHSYDHYCCTMEKNRGFEDVRSYC